MRSISSTWGTTTRPPLRGHVMAKSSKSSGTAGKRLPQWRSSILRSWVTKKTHLFRLLSGSSVASWTHKRTTFKSTFVKPYFVSFRCTQAIACRDAQAGRRRSRSHVWRRFRPRANRNSSRTFARGLQLQKFLHATIPTRRLRSANRINANWIHAKAKALLSKTCKLYRNKSWKVLRRLPSGVFANKLATCEREPFDLSSQGWDSRNFRKLTGETGNSFVD